MADTYIYQPRPTYTNPQLTPGTKYQGKRVPPEVELILPGVAAVKVPFKQVAIDRSISDDDLRKAATHVSHEIRMIASSWSHRSNAFAYTSWFTHCRNLIVFFDGTSPIDDDVYAQDFFEDAEKVQWVARRAALPEPPEYEKYTYAANKLAAHLTYARARDPDLATIKPDQSVTEYLSGLNLLFLRTLVPERLAW